MRNLRTVISAEKTEISIRVIRNITEFSIVKKLPAFSTEKLRSFLEIGNKYGILVVVRRSIDTCNP
jgi:pyruvate carboxylase